MTGNKEVDVATDLAVRRLIARYCQLIDDGDFKAVGDLYTDDGRFSGMGMDVRSRDDIVEWLTSLTATMWHSVTNVVVSKGSHDGTYHAVSDLAFHTKGDDGKWKVGLVGRYHDTLVGSGREMRFCQRIITAR